MTIAVGILCSDGVVLASDSCATSGTKVNNQPVQKSTCDRNCLGNSSKGAVKCTFKDRDKGKEKIEENIH